MNRKYIIGGACALIILGIGMFFGFGAKGNSQNNNADFMSAFKGAQNAMLVDVRTAGEYAEGHIEGAVNIDFYDPAFVEKVKSLGAGKQLFLYCRSGNRSGQALQALVHAGLSAQHLEGGVMSHPELLQ